MRLWPLVIFVELGVFVALAALSVAAHEAGPLPGDEWITHRVQDLPEALEPAAEAIRAATGTRVVLASGAVLAAVLWLRGRRRQALALTLALAVLPFTQSGLKDLVDRPRPDPLLIDRRAGFSSESFPSGHVMSGTLLLGFAAWQAWLLERRWSRIAAIALVVFVLLNGLANVYEGVHWPTDVVGGYLGAAMLLLPAFWWAQRMAPALSRRRGMGGCLRTS